MKQFRFFLFISAIVGCHPADTCIIPRDNEHNHTITSSAPVDSSNADSLVVATVPAHPGIMSFVPKHYVIHDSVWGDLNLDPYPDAIVVLRSDKETPGGFAELPRPVLLLLGNAAGGYDLAVRNDHLTMEQIDGQMFGEPYNGCKIDSGSFTLLHYGGSRFRWTHDYVFTYDATTQSWFYTTSYATAGDMFGEMNDLDSLGQCIPYAYDTLIPKHKTDVRKFDIRTAEVADAMD